MTRQEQNARLLESFPRRARDALISRAFLLSAFRRHLPRAFPCPRFRAVYITVAQHLLPAHHHHMCLPTITAAGARQAQRYKGARGSSVRHHHHVIYHATPTPVRHSAEVQVAHSAHDDARRSVDAQAKHLRSRYAAADICLRERRCHDLLQRRKRCERLCA